MGSDTTGMDFGGGIISKSLKDGPDKQDRDLEHKETHSATAHYSAVGPAEEGGQGHKGASATKSKTIARILEEYQQYFGWSGERQHVHVE